MPRKQITATKLLLKRRTLLTLLSLQFLIQIHSGIFFKLERKDLKTIIQTYEGREHTAGLRVYHLPYQAKPKLIPLTNRWIYSSVTQFSRNWWTAC